MLDIKITNINYNIDDDGNTRQIGTTFSGYEGNESVNANIPVTEEDLEKDVTFDDLTRKQIEALGRKKLAEITAVKQIKQVAYEIHSTQGRLFLCRKKMMRCEIWEQDSTQQVHITAIYDLLNLGVVCVDASS